MTIIKTRIHTRESARHLRFERRTNFPHTNVQTAIEAIASDGVLYADRVGVIGDGVTNNDAALALVTAAIGNGYSEVVLPNGVIKFTQWDLSGKANFVLRGHGATGWGSNVTGTTLCCTASGGDAAIILQDCKGFTIRDLGIAYNSLTYSGYLVYFVGDGTWNEGSFVNVHFYQRDATTFTAAACAYVNHAVHVSWERCRFSHCVNAVIGALTGETPGAACHTFLDCVTISLSGAAAFVNPGLAWNFISHKFESASDGKPCGIITTGTHQVISVACLACTFADPVNSGVWVDVGDTFGLTIIGGSMAGDISGGGHVVYGLRCGATFNSGVVVHGVEFSGLTAGVVFNALTTGSSVKDCTAPNTTALLLGTDNLSDDFDGSGNNPQISNIKDNRKKEHGRCMLAKSGANLLLSPKDGNQLLINQVRCTIPSFGVSLAPTGLTPGTLYYIYARDADGDGVVDALEASTTTHATSSTDGVEIKSGDATRTMVGWAYVVAGPAFADTAQQRLVRTWFNDTGISCNVALSLDHTMSSATAAELNGATDRIAYIRRAGETFTHFFSSFAKSNAGGGTVFSQMRLNGFTVGNLGGGYSYTANAFFNLPVVYAETAPNDAYVEQAMFGASDGVNTATFVAANTTHGFTSSGR